MGCQSGKVSGEHISNPKKMKSLNSSSKSIKSSSSLRVTKSMLSVRKEGNFFDNYFLLKSLGKGAFGEVRKTRHKTSGIDNAVKIISKRRISEEDQYLMINEVNILRDLDHPNIIKIYEVYEDENEIYIVQELCTGGELFDRILKNKNFSEKVAARTIKQVFSAVKYCHLNNIVHRDLKPENLLYESKSEDALLKIIDFGTSNVFDPSKKMSKRFGTPYYIAPEVIEKHYDYKCDIWSCGVILYILFCGYPPFNSPDKGEIIKKVKAGKYSMSGPEWDIVSEEAKDLITHILEYNPKIRYDAKEVLNHTWFQKYSTEQEFLTPQMDMVFGKMKELRTEQKLQEAVWLFIVNYIASKEERAELMEIFQKLDVNGDGNLSREELIEGFTNIYQGDSLEEEVDQILSKIGNETGTIRYTDFVVATINREKLLTPERLEKAFKILDKDGSGCIDIGEFKDFFGGSNISDKVWKEMIKEVDENGDGEVIFRRK